MRALAYYTDMTPAEMARRSHESLKKRLGGDEQYRDYMRQLAEKRHAKRKSKKGYVERPLKNV